MQGTDSAISEQDRMRAVRDARIREKLDTDHELYRVIDKKPGSGVYELLNSWGGQAAKVYGSVRRLKEITGF
ncbi:MAG: hypothetical protein A4E49_02462 [Methanosaeta sp. PtaU1.Bin112]|nr:MAG: hypothetical protein A4E49_02462 [Methanosaeta sp. PtaU1.Bin112]